MKMHKKIIVSVFFIISIFSTLSSISFAYSCNAIPISTEEEDQIASRICSDGEGGALVTWTGNRSGLGYDIFAQKININGNKEWGSIGIAVSTEEGYQKASKICSDGNGGAIVTWVNDSNSFILAQRINASGNLLWEASGVLISTNGFVIGICSDNYGGAIIAWDYLDNFYAQRISSNGSIIWDIDGVVICNATSFQKNLQFFCDENGNSFFTWYDYRNSEISIGNWDTDIYAQRVDINGIVQWEANGTEICVADKYQSNSQICTDGAGGAIINWVDMRNYTYSAQRVNSTGDRQWGSDGIIIANYTHWEAISTMISDSEGGAIIAAELFTGSLYAVRINSSGDQLYITRLYTTDLNWITGEELCSDGQGGTFISWLIGIPPPQTGAYTYDILAQHIDSNGNIFWPESGRIICNAPGDQASLDICSYGAGKAFISWRDYSTSGNDKIYYTILEKRREEESINFGNFYLLFTFIALFSLVILSRRRIRHNHIY